MRRLPAALLILPALALVVACSRPPEQQQLTQFFRAARARDNATVARMSVVGFDPREQGSVDGFSITSIGEETREPLSFAPLTDALAKVKAEQDDFLAKKIEYQNANIKTIEEVLKLERDPNAKMTAAQQKVKAEWDTWREGINAHQRAVSQAEAAIKTAVAPVEVSLTQPGQPKFDMNAFKGDVITKDVVINANFTNADGQTSEKPLTITFMWIAGTQDGAQREGRAIITKIDGV